MSSTSSLGDDDNNNAFQDDNDDSSESSIVEPGAVIHGTQIKLEKIVGEGTFGEVYSAYYMDSEDQTPNLAVKVLKISNDDQLTQFNKEAAISELIRSRFQTLLNIQNQPPTSTSSTTPPAVPRTTTSGATSSSSTSGATSSSRSRTARSSSTSEARFVRPRILNTRNSFCYQLNADKNNDNSGVVCMIEKHFDQENDDVGFLVFPLIEGREMFSLITDNSEILLKNAQKVLKLQKVIVDQMEEDNQVDINAIETMQRLELQFKNAEKNFNNTLHGLIAAGRYQLWLKICLTIARKLYDIVDTLHSMDIYHGDVKPENIIIQNLNISQLIQQNNTDLPKNISVLLLDFGLSCANSFENTRAPRIVRCKEIEPGGTGGFRDTDLIRAVEIDRNVSFKRSYVRKLLDLHALGVTVYQMLNDNNFIQYNNTGQFRFKKPKILGDHRNWGKYGDNFSIKDVFELNDLVYAIVEDFPSKISSIDIIRKLDKFISKL